MDANGSFVQWATAFWIHNKRNHLWWFFAQPSSPISQITNTETLRNEAIFGGTESLFGSLTTEERMKQTGKLSRKVQMCTGSSILCVNIV